MSGIIPLTSVFVPYPPEGYVYSLESEDVRIDPEQEAVRNKINYVHQSEKEGGFVINLGLLSPEELVSGSVQVRLRTKIYRSNPDKERPPELEGTQKMGLRVDFSDYLSEKHQKILATRTGENRDPNIYPVSLENSKPRPIVFARWIIL